MTVPLPYHKAGLCVLQINCKNYDLSREETEPRVSQLPMNYIPRLFSLWFLFPFAFEVGYQQVAQMDLELALKLRQGLELVIFWL